MTSSVFDSWKQEWFDAATKAGHTLIQDMYGVDVFVHDSGFHNGPGCSTCGEKWCMHCVFYEDIEPCRKSAKSVFRRKY